MEDDRFVTLLQQDGQEQFADDGADDWRQKWFVDGLRADIRNTQGKSDRIDRIKPDFNPFLLQS